MCQTTKCLRSLSPIPTIWCLLLFSITTLLIITCENQFHFCVDDGCLFLGVILLLSALFCYYCLCCLGVMLYKNCICHALIFGVDQHGVMILLFSFTISLCLISYTEGKLVKGESTQFHPMLTFNIGTQALLPRNFNLVTDENCV